MPSGFTVTVPPAGSVTATTWSEPTGSSGSLAPSSTAMSTSRAPGVGVKVRMCGAATGGSLPGTGAVPTTGLITAFVADEDEALVVRPW